MYCFLLLFFYLFYLLFLLVLLLGFFVSVLCFCVCAFFVLVYERGGGILFLKKKHFYFV